MKVVPIPDCLHFACNVTLEAYELAQLQANADAGLSHWRTKVVGNSTERDLMCGYISNWWEIQEYVALPGSNHQIEYPLGKHSMNRHMYIDTNSPYSAAHPAYVLEKSFSFDVANWETQISLIMSVYRRQYKINQYVYAGFDPQPIIELRESNDPEDFDNGSVSDWEFSQEIAVDYLWYNGASWVAIPIVDRANNIADMPLNTRMCIEDGNPYVNINLNLSSYGSYTPPAPGTTRRDVLRVRVINVHGSTDGTNPVPLSYFIMGNGTMPVNDYAGVENIYFAMSKETCV